MFCQTAPFRASATSAGTWTTKKSIRCPPPSTVNVPRLVYPESSLPRRLSAHHLRHHRWASNGDGATVATRLEHYSRSIADRVKPFQHDREGRQMKFTLERGSCHGFARIRRTGEQELAAVCLADLLNEIHSLSGTQFLGLGYPKSHPNPHSAENCGSRRV